MAPTAPTPAWRKVCEEYFTRLIEDLELHVDSEVESRVSAAVEAAVRGAVTDAVAESRRALAEELNQGIRRLRQCSSVEELYAALLDVSAPFSEQAIVFSIDGKLARAERMRSPAAVEAGEDKVANDLPALEIAFTDAAAFATAVETRDPVIAIRAAAELSQPLFDLCGQRADEKVYLFPLVAREQATGLLFSAGSVEPPALELLSGVAALQFENLTTGPVATEVEVAVPVQAAHAEHQNFVSVSSMWQRPLAAMAASATAVPGSTETALHPEFAGRDEWKSLTREQQQQHLAAQRFARVQVAEMRLAQPQTLRAGSGRRDIYGALKQPIETARENFREKFMIASPTMVDYLHLEMMRSLANDDATLLGPDYPGPLL